MDPALISRDYGGRRDELWKAAHECNVAKVQLLLEGNQADPNFVNQISGFGTTPLHAAILAAVHGWRQEDDYLKVCKLLLDHGANVLSTSPGGETPLFYSVHQSGSEHFLKLIFQKRPLLDVNTKSGFVKCIRAGGETPLFTAVYHLGFGVCYKKKIEFLINHGADVNATTDDGNSIFHSNCLDMWTAAKLLLAGADINIPNAIGLTPLLRLAHEYVKIQGTTSPLPLELERCIEKIRILTQNDANCDIKDRSGRTAEDVVFECLMEQNSETMQQFAAAGGLDVTSQQYKEVCKEYLYTHDPVLVMLREWRISKEKKILLACYGLPSTINGSTLSEFGSNTLRMVAGDEKTSMNNLSP